MNKKLKEVYDLLYDWRIHIDVPIGNVADFHLLPKDDKEISELIESELNSYADDIEIKPENIIEPDNIEDDLELEDDLEEDFDPDIDLDSLDLSDFLSEFLRDMGKKMDEIKEKDPGSIIKYEDSEECDLGFYVYEGDLFVCSSFTDVPVSGFSEGTQDKICKAIKRGLKKIKK